jgi:lysophospholipase L1-like esterase
MPATPPPPRHLALGDSYTIGEAVAAAERWPAVLAQRLRQAGVDVGEPQIVAVTGWTTDELAQGMDAAALLPAHDLVTLQIGVNNQYRGRGLDEYAVQFGALLERAIALAGGRAGRVLVVSIPDWGVTRFAREQRRDPARIAGELDDFNACARDLAASRGVRFVDITPISRRHPDMVAADGLHPSAEQYALWVEAILPIAREALR